MSDDIYDQIHEVSPSAHDPKTQTSSDVEARAALERYFANSAGTATEKLENFPKYAPRQSLARFLARYELFKIVADTQGSIIECGVLLGGGLLSFAKLSAILEPYNFQRRVIGFDTFTGFTEVDEHDHLGRSERKSSSMHKGGFSASGGYEDILAAVDLFDGNRFISHIPKVEVVRGDFLQTGPKYLEDYPHLVVSCLYLDFDMYKPTRLALELFLPRIPRGGIIVFDELNEEAFPGETLAVLDTLALNSLRIRRFPFEPRISYAVIGD